MAQLSTRREGTDEEGCFRVFGLFVFNDVLKVVSQSSSVFCLVKWKMGRGSYVSKEPPPPFLPTAAKTP